MNRTHGSFFAAILLAANIPLAVNQAHASTVSEFDVLVATSNLTVVGTTTLRGNSFSVGVSSLVVFHGNVGIGTSTPQAQLHILGPILRDGFASQFLWIASSGAFRVGLATGTPWSEANIGPFSVAFGQNNRASGDHAGIFGGIGNVAAGPYSFIGGGDFNSTDLGAWESSIAGGALNAASGFDTVVAGGIANLAFNDGAAVGGGVNNFATGRWATIPGGSGNTASGPYTFAAGKAASAVHQGAFVWADSNALGGAFSSAAVDEFRVRAQNGFVFHASVSSPTIIVSGNSIIISTSPTAAIATPNIYISSETGYVGVGNRSPTAELDVNGAAQFGMGAVKSTFTASPAGSTYALQLSSGITLARGGVVNLTSGGFIRFSDNSILTTAPTSGGMLVSSFTVPGAFTFSSADVGTTGFTTCLANSSVTITATGKPIMVVLNIGVYCNSTETAWAGFLEDGAFISPFTSTKGASSDACGGTGYRANLSFSVLIRPPATGTRVYCPSFWGSVGGFESDSTNAPQFGVYELK